MPNYAIDLTHTVGLNNVIVLTNTFSITPDRSAQPDYGWAFQQARRPTDRHTHLPEPLDQLAAR